MVKTTFTETIGSLCRPFFWIICFLPFFYFERKIFGLSSKSLRRSCNHCILRVHRNVLRKNKNWIFRKKYKFFIILGDWKENFSGVVNTTFTETIGSLCRPFFWIICFLPFLYFEQKIFGLSSKSLRRSCNHCILRVHRNVLRKNKNWIFRKSISFLSFLETGAKLQRGGQDYIHRDNRIFMQTIFLNYMFFTIFVLWAKNFRPFVKKSSAKL